MPQLHYTSKRRRQRRRTARRLHLQVFRRARSSTLCRLTATSTLAMSSDLYLKLTRLYRIANQLMNLSSIVAAPFELIIATVFLYQLLGWTCLAGLSIMAISLPINHVLVKRRIRVRAVAEDAEVGN